MSGKDRLLCKQEAVGSKALSLEKTGNRLRFTAVSRRLPEAPKERLNIPLGPLRHMTAYTELSKQSFCPLGMHDYINTNDYSLYCSQANTTGAVQSPPCLVAADRVAAGSG